MKFFGYRVVPQEIDPWLSESGFELGGKLTYFFDD